MGENRSLLTALGSILGLVLFIFVIMQAVSYFREGTMEFDEMQRQAGQPVLLSETLHEAEGTGEEVAASESVTETESVDAGTDVAASSEVTTTAAVTESTTMTATEAVTTGEELSATDEMTVAATDGITDTGAVTTTEASTETGEVAAADAVTTTAAVASGEVPTATEAITTTDTVTDDSATDESATEEATTEEAATEEEAPAEEVAMAVPAPDEVAPIFTKAGCIGCHVIPEIPGAVGAVGPDLTGIGTTAATRVEGLSAEEYLYQSILQPNEFIVPECPTGPCLPGLMVQNLGDVLTPEEIDSVVAYLASLTSE